MRGRWLVKFGSWIARRETFERMIAPAISDMQVEASRGRLSQWKHYVAIGLVFIHAVLQDFRLDLVSAFDTEARRLVWKRAAIWYVGAVALFTILGLLYNMPYGTSLNGVWSAALTSTVLAGIVTAMVYAVTVAVFYLCRRASSRRMIVLVSLIAAALTVAVAVTVRPVRISADQVLYASIGHSSYWEAKLDPQIGRWKDIQSGIGVIPFAILAVVLARRRGGMRVAATLFCYFVSWFLMVRMWMSLVVGTMLSLGIYQPPSEIMQGWREIGFNLTLAVVWLTMDSLLRRIWQPNLN